MAAKLRKSAKNRQQTWAETVGSLCDFPKTVVFNFKKLNLINLIFLIENNGFCEFPKAFHGFCQRLLMVFGRRA